VRNFKIVDILIQERNERVRKERKKERRVARTKEVRKGKNEGTKETLTDST
jgi:hypothetical protein